MTAKMRAAPLIAAGLMLALSACAGSMVATGEPALAKPSAAANPMVGGEPMLDSKTIVDNAVQSKDHTTLVAAVKAAGLVDTLSSPGPFTVFAPTNAAFGMLPKETVPTLLKPENKPQLTKVLTYHVVPGTIDRATLWSRVRAGGGKASLKTAAGETLTVMENGPTNLVVADARGTVASIATYDVWQSNGVIHVVDHVLLP